ncbi:hypothetical protein ASG60_11315 [Methylobacterium sp. Leaf469]|jgi:hypothetical protein|uniref:hypothetical protein n=1 Tax=unclassified Methylobacterium TaxID=2615210 RepID=UPI0006FF9DED|nr:MULTISPECIES: hypothetical protein [unclassified Methylobacterium]KQP29072.1 hypothetical protein ASF25_06850 [Methylobacterium sp. Leaf100]KQT87652.1 hypothetical protein ASG60_11315 [Methylobacterium sp. Leaf469]USU31981.1 hypothetical protein NG677_22340 [Methylobacterium sp. OTU13CASTA1]
MTKTLALLSAAAILCASAAVAQPAPPPPGGPKTGPEAGAPPPPPPHGGPRGPRGGPDAPPPPPKAAQFRLERGDTALDVKCAADEPMKACAEIALQMLDKLAAMPAPAGPAPKPRD